MRTLPLLFFPDCILTKKPSSRRSELDSGTLKTYNSAVQEYAYIHDEGDIPAPLLEVPFLEAFSKEHLDEVLHAAAFIECEPGDVIIAEGDEASRIFILLAGEVALEIPDDELDDWNP